MSVPTSTPQPQQLTSKGSLLIKIAIPVFAGMGFGLLSLIQYITFVPHFHNGLMIASDVCDVCAIMCMFRLAATLRIRKVFRVLIYFILVCLTVASCWSSYALLTVQWRPATHFEYQEKTYYYAPEGFVSKRFDIYEQDSTFTMTKIGKYNGRIDSTTTLTEQEKAAIVEAAHREQSLAPLEYIP